MAEFTYAANIKPLKQRREEELAEAKLRASAYEQEAARIYDGTVAAQRDQADRQIAAAKTAYSDQFDVNAAQQLANERRLREQMANMGLLKSGYNAANQTALALQRSRADAAARTARQAAVEAITQSLQQYEAGIRQKQASEALARRQGLEEDALDAAYNLYRNDISAAKDQRDYAVTLQKFVDSHNGDIYKLMQSAYNSGNAALGNEYAEQLWRLGEDGIIRQGTFDTSKAAAYARQVGENKLASKAAASAKNGGDSGLGYPTQFKDTVKLAREFKLNREQNRAMDVLYYAVKNSGMTLNDDQVRAMCNVVGVPFEILAYCRDNKITPSQYAALQSGG